MSEPKIQRSSDYSKFHFSKENRNVDVTNMRSRNLRASLKKYGWLVAYPAMVRNNGKGLLVIDGQHRITIAQELGLSVLYVIDDTRVDVAEINQAQRAWGLHDYLNRWIKAGKEDYVDLQRFYESHSLTLGMAMALLGGTYSIGNKRRSFMAGTYKITTPKQATQLATAYDEIIKLNPAAKNTNFLKALYGCFYVDDFDGTRFLKQCRKSPHLIHPYARIEDFLEMIEDIYNHGRHVGRLPLKFLAQEAMKNRRAM